MEHFLFIFRRSLRQSLKTAISLAAFMLINNALHAQLVVNGATLTINGATITVNGDLNQINGTTNNDGVLNVRGNLTQGGNFNNTSSINLTGNLQANGSFTSAASSVVTLNGTTQQQIGGNSAVPFGILRLGNAAGVSLGQHITLGTSLDMTSRLGDLNLNGFIADFGDLGEILGESNTNSIVNSKTTGYVSARRTVGSFAINPANIGLVLTTTNNLGRVIVRRSHQIFSNCEGVGLSRYYDIIAERNGKLDLVYTYFDREVNNLSKNTLSLFSSIDKGTNWTEIPTTIVNVDPSMTAKQVDVGTQEKRIAGFKKPQRLNVNASASRLVCPNSNLELNADTIAQATYEWTGPNNFRRSGRNITIPYSQNLISGVYVLNTRLKSCLYTDSLTVKVSKGISFDIKTQEPNCFAGSNGKILITSAIDTTLVYSIGTSSGRKGRNITFDSLRAGMYSLRIVSVEGCIDIRTLMITNPTKFEISVAQTELKVGKGRSVALQAIGGQDYRWLPNSNIDNTNISNPTVTPTESVVYKVTGVNARGCEASAEVKITVLDESSLNPNKVLSPNGDGISDVWLVENIDLFPENVLFIFNRWGQKIIEIPNYKSDWGGTSQKGDPLPEGGYYFVIKIPSVAKPLAGTINLIR